LREQKLHGLRAINKNLKNGRRADMKTLSDFAIWRSGEFKFKCHFPFAFDSLNC